MANVPTPISSSAEPTSTRTTSSTHPRAKVRAPATDTSSVSTSVGTTWQPGTGDPNWSIDQDSTGFAPEVSKGYDAESTQLNAQRKANAMQRVSGFLLNSNRGYQMPLFITAINIDTSLAGSTAQSQLIQDFYPRNFVQPVINVYGMSLDQEDYGTLCEFVHNCQFNALYTPATWADSMVQLIVLGDNGFDGSKGNVRNGPVGGRSQGRMVQSTFTQIGGVPQNQLHVNQSIRGSHDSIIAKGYINSMPRIHQQFQYATEWQFDFTVAQMLNGPFRENSAAPSNLPNQGGRGPSMWADMVKAAQTAGLSSTTAKQNKASLAYAAAHNATLVDTTPTS